MRLTKQIDLEELGYDYVLIDETNQPSANYKLGQLEDIEEELGIELATLIKAFQQGYIYLDIKENNKGISEIVKFGVGGILFDKENKVWRLTNDDRYDGAYWGSLATNKNYGKTWALTKEELEK